MYRPPAQGPDRLKLFLLGFSYEERQAGVGGEEPGSEGKNLSEVLDCAEGHYFGRPDCAWGGGWGIGAGRGKLVSHRFGAAGDYIDVHQCKCAGYLAEEGGLLVIGFDHREADIGGPDFDGESRETRTGAEVYYGGPWPGGSGQGEEVAGQEE